MKLFESVVDLTVMAMMICGLRFREKASMVDNMRVWSSYYLVKRIDWERVCYCKAAAEYLPV